MVGNFSGRKQRRDTERYRRLVPHSDILRHRRQPLDSRVPKTMWVPQSFAHFANDWALDYGKILEPDGA